MKIKRIERYCYKKAKVLKNIAYDLIPGASFGSDDKEAGEGFKKDFVKNIMESDLNKKEKKILKKYWRCFCTYQDDIEYDEYTETETLIGSKCFSVQPPTITVMSMYFPLYWWIKYKLEDFK